MIAAEVIVRAREAAIPVFWREMDQAGVHLDSEDRRERRIAIQESRKSADAALRSVLTDLRAESVFFGFPGTAASGWECAQPVIDDLLRELGE